jgi:hypothetical protein
MISVLLSHQSAGTVEISRRIHLYAKTARLDQAYRDSHARFERAQLFKPLALFKYATGQSDKPLQRGAAIRVQPDVFVMRPVAPWHDRLAEI